MDEKAECETVAQKMRELAIELERDGYPAAAITDGMLMVALDAATRSLGRATCRTSLASWRAGSRRRPTRLRDALRRIERGAPTAGLLRDRGSGSHSRFWAGIGFDQLVGTELAVTQRTWSRSSAPRRDPPPRRCVPRLPSGPDRVVQVIEYPCAEAVTSGSRCINRPPQPETAPGSIRNGGT